MRYREIAKKLSALGCMEMPRTGAGSHRKWHNPATNRISVLPDWAGDDLKLGTVRAAIRQLGLTWDEYERA